MDNVKTVKKREKSESCYSNSNTREQDEILVQPFVSFTKLNDTSIQSNFLEAVRAFNFWMKIPEDKMSLIENITALLKISGDLCDTFKDDAIVKKEMATVHSIYGVPSTINAAGYVSAISMEKALLLGDNKIMKIFAFHLKEIYNGFMQEYEWSDRLDECPREEEYMKVCVSKMGSCFKMAVEVMQRLSNSDQNFVDLCEILGVFFCLYEDFVFLRSNSKEGSFGSLYRDYVSARKFNFPIIHAFHNRRDDIILSGIFRRKTNNTNVKRYFVASLEKNGSFDYTQQVLLNFKIKAEDEIKKLGGNAYLSHVLQNILLELNNNKTAINF